MAASQCVQGTLVVRNHALYITIISSRTRFSDRLKSGDRPKMKLLASFSVLAFSFCGLLSGCATHQPNPPSITQAIPPGCPTDIQPLRAEGCRIRDQAVRGSMADIARFSDIAAALAQQTDKYPNCPVRFFMDPCS